MKKIDELKVNAAFKCKFMVFEEMIRR